MARGRAGRTARRRRRRKRDGSTQTESLGHQQKYVRLMKFLHGRGFTSTPLQPALFSDTDRGLQTLQPIQPGGMLVSLPESCLLTTSTVLHSYLGPFLKSWKPRPSSLVALCVFLVCERHRGEASDWFPYIDVLPCSYCCPPYFTDTVMAVLPSGVRRRAEEQREGLQHLYAVHQDFFMSLQPVLSHPPEEVLTYEALRWAWCSINTRSVFMDRPSSSFLSGPDNYALAPFLDLLNHRPDVQVKAGFNRTSGCYEIRSISGVQRYHQAFINYGSHDNQRLLLEYGFVSSCNPHSVIYVEEDLLCEVLRGDESLDEKMKFLRENGFLQNLTLSDEGPSWRLLTALRLLSPLPIPRQRWRTLLLGQMVSDEEAQRSVQTAKTLCERLLRETRTSLQEISHLLQQSERPVREQLQVVGSLRREERCILGNCLEVLKSALEI
ncbi:SET domain-containing protein 4 isoform X1 [Oryzias latipes]|uniref:SET domain-containing protein 4 isoform X1 n=2 Tax=Oryzias latipes TaxID=8090 RepID=UPI0005CBD3E3|nr:SET domain-containing protein 4 isoform X1 [Oryzias latipes]XP_020564893.1 SET domain-containing protein 4 isoform X1 [Oryzias latipes]XP_020564894.1 SET domain-containing protein 4 isoform X1 [Oryzias latipes]